MVAIAGEPALRHRTRVPAPGTWINQQQLIGGQIPLFYVPLVLVGFDPALVLTLFGFNLQYQFLLHTEARLSLGPPRSE